MNKRSIPAFIKLWASLVAQSGKNPPEMQETACNVGDMGSIPGLGRSPEAGNGNPLQYSCLEKSHGWRRLVGYSPWGHKESDMTDRLHFHFHLVEGLLPDKKKRG